MKNEHSLHGPVYHGYLLLSFSILGSGLSTNEQHQAVRLACDSQAYPVLHRFVEERLLQCLGQEIPVE